MSSLRVPSIDYDRHPAYSSFLTPWWAKERWQCGAYCALLVLSEYLNIKWKRGHLLLSKLFSRRPYQTVSTPVGLAELKSHGIYLLRASDEEIARLSAHLRSHKQDVLIQKQAKDRPSFSDCISIIRTEALNAIQLFMKEHGILSLAALYLQSDSVVMQDVFYQENDTRDKLNQDVFSDMGIPDPKTLNFHIDYSFQTLKIIIYLSRVEEDTGPFGYISGSHTWIVGDWELANRYALAKWTRMGTNPADRRKIVSLPRLLRKKAQFGNDMLDSDPYTKEFLAAEHKVFSIDSNIIVFDNSGVHRGGIVKKGSRAVLQVLLAQK
jgi:hypothetical protein